MSLSHVVGLNESSMPSSPIPDSSASTRQHKRQRVDICEEQVNEIVDILGTMLIKIKNEIMDIKEKYAPTAAVNFLLRRMESSDAILTNDVYCLMTGFMTVYLAFIELLLKDLSNNSNNSKSNPLEDFMQLFSENDTLFGNDNPFLWYYLYARSNTCILDDLDKQLNVHFTSLNLIDSIFSRFYTVYFLGEESNTQKKHQKDHGQYYTPHSVIRFMWDRCLLSSSSLLHTGNIPRVFDPCLGIGSFLCEFLSRLVSACRFNVDIWNDPNRLYSILTREIPESVYGIEIDPFAFQLCKINMLIHLFPFYERLLELNVQLIQTPRIIQRIRLFCNDTLRLDKDSNAFTNDIDPFELDCLSQLRDSSKLKFHYIVTNPPYMIRKTGFITQPDPQLYNEQVLGGRGTQAYLYFMWICLQRCDDSHGQVCLITPSQWTVLEFAAHLREWIWSNCKLLEMYEFEPYKVWPKVQTDSLIFRVCKRSCVLPRTDKTTYLRHTSSRRIPLKGLLTCYENFDMNQNNPDIMFKCTSTVDPIATCLSTIIPTSSVLDKLMALTEHLPRICDGEGRKINNANMAPLVWNRGPNTNPVYSLVVRTEWALPTFGLKACARWLRPCFYWNGKSSLSESGGGKEGKFWKERDALRLEKKEFSAAEAYWPFCNLTKSKVPYYSMIMVNKEDAETLQREYEQWGEQSETASLYHYLHEARMALQPNKKDQLANCQYNKNGAEHAVKLVHPINCGYFTRSQPRQRFFLDKSRMVVTNQCIYFTIKPESKIQDADFFCGLLNCSLYQFFIKSTCYYDQQGRMRFFGRLMANIPYMPPDDSTITCYVSRFSQGITTCRTWLYAIIRLAPNTKGLMERIRNNEYQLSTAELDLIKGIHGPIEPDSSLPVLSDDGHFAWVHDFVLSRRVSIDKVFVTLLKTTCLFQFAIDQLVYCLYKIPFDLQLGMEDELNLKKNRIKELPPILENDANAWSEGIIDYAKKLTLIYNNQYLML